MFRSKESRLLVGGILLIIALKSREDFYVVL